eukprot:TRINITY_DN17026_c0_g1_i1.p1 TRINITY_DN17026_c0_g1~~TRINITY_DN17026_c0_g1_i1.p1  ORF type:complete len:479 (-),score=98.47 TRINITY_DN17026_c0_g1_i1:33-1469(-)
MIQIAKIKHQYPALASGITRLHGRIAALQAMTSLTHRQLNSKAAAIVEATEEAKRLAEHAEHGSTRSRRVDDVVHEAPALADWFWEIEKRITALRSSVKAAGDRVVSLEASVAEKGHTIELRDSTLHAATKRCEHIVIMARGAGFSEFAIQGDSLATENWSTGVLDNTSPELAANLARIVLMLQAAAASQGIGHSRAGAKDAALSEAASAVDTLALIAQKGPGVRQLEPFTYIPNECPELAVSISKAVGCMSASLNRLHSELHTTQSELGILQQKCSQMVVDLEDSRQECEQVVCARALEATAAISQQAELSAAITHLKLEMQRAGTEGVASEASRESTGQLIRNLEAELRASNAECAKHRAHVQEAAHDRVMLTRNLGMQISQSEATIDDLRHQLAQGLLARVQAEAAASNSDSNMRRLKIETDQKIIDSESLYGRQLSELAKREAEQRRRNDLEAWRQTHENLMDHVAPFVSRPSR